MKLFFREYMGLDKHNTTHRGQINMVLRESCYTFLRNLNTSGGGRRYGTRKYNSLISRVMPPSDIRGGGRKLDDHNKVINNTKYIFERFMGTMESMGATVIASPYSYTYNIGSRGYEGTIDAVLDNGIMDVVTFNFSAREPSDDVINHGIHTTLASYMYRYLFPDIPNHRIIDYWIPGDSYIEVYRMEGQYAALQRELDILSRVVEHCVDTGGWYRSKGFWCGSCYLVDPCNEVKF